MRHAVGVGAAYAFGLFVLFVLAMTVLMDMRQWAEVPIGAVLAGHAGNVFVGGFMAGKRTRAAGWVVGVVVAMLYVGMLALLGYLGFERAFTPMFAGVGGLCAGIGLLAGAFGVNRRRA
jgi:putative membrane protein (TIGR04086 family)